ncbi:MAG: radical SAM protein [Anaerolineae bacterium]|nr:radical SAM protein [Anaerolineales bacterium]MCQ3977645.1 radical SAM protein [Anaerolineae bacterium]
MARTFGIDAFRRYLTLKTHKIHALPVAILMPHSSCNCQCVMCDIWKGNGNVQQLTEADAQGLLTSFKKLGTQWVVMSGGEALMNPNLFRLCDLLRAQGLKITILSTGLLLKRYAEQVVSRTDEVIVSLDGSEAVHNAIRRIPNAFQKLAEGVQAVKALNPRFPISARCVIQRLNFADWPNIIDAAHTIGLDGISFLPADVSSEAFNRPELWGEERTEEVKLDQAQLPHLQTMIESLIANYAADFASGYIAESPAKIRRIYDYYAAFYGLTDFPLVRCNAPWVSTVVEADGTVRSCFFHHALGNIRQTPLPDLLNSPEAIAFRQNLDMDTDAICRKCVCSLNLRPTVKIRNGSRE